MNLIATAKLLGVIGLMHEQEADALVHLAVERHVAEIGSFCGFSAWAMATTAKSVLCVDTFMANDAGQSQQHELTTLNTFQHITARYRNVRHMVCSSIEAAGMHLRMRSWFDMIFLDGLHTREGVLSDIEAWLPMLNSGGIMVFHDYGHPDFPGVKEAADQHFGLPLPQEIVHTLRLCSAGRSA